MKRGVQAAEKAVLVGLSLGARERRRAEASLEELADLTRSAGASVLATVLQERQRRDPATVIGKGKLAHVAQLCDEASANLVVFDEELSPAQQRNVEKALGRKTLDRTQVILDIFARRARTREGRLQVELAQLEYALPRLSGKGVLLSRLGGGIGTRGPGETKLETDRRRIRQRIQAVKREIEGVRSERGTRREGRTRSAMPVVSLVGYTSAGKSTLFSGLTHAGTPISDQLFMTLDPLVRRVTLRGGRAFLLVDTVGFIQKLPHTVVEAFRATLEEVTRADLLLHVIDVSAEDVPAREAAVESVLAEIGAAERPRLSVLNKADLVLPERIAGLASGHPGSVVISAKLGTGLPELVQAIESRLELAPRTVRLRFGAQETQAIAGLYSSGRIRSHEVQGTEVWIEADLPERLIGRYQERMA